MKRRKPRTREEKEAARDARIGCDEIILAAIRRKGGAHEKRGYVRRPKHRGREGDE